MSDDRGSAGKQLLALVLLPAPAQGVRAGGQEAVQGWAEALAECPVEGTNTCLHIRGARRPGQWWAGTGRGPECANILTQVHVHTS